MHRLLDPTTWLSLFIVSVFVVVARDYLRQSNRIVKEINDNHPELWSALFVTGWARRNSFRQSGRAGRLERLILFGFPNGTKDRYPELSDLVAKCRVSAFGVILLLAMAIISVAEWPAS